MKLTDRLTLAEGDILSSTLHTLTVPVNTVGVMGKGLALQVKQQFPKVYAQYHEACERQALQVGRPIVIKQSTDKWFLLFPTKKYWRADSKIEYIIDGLQWVADNYKAWGLKSLALPALGCGLGKLEWKDVGPLICSTVSRFEIPVGVYLPTEKPIDPTYLKIDYLLR